ncbi:MAG: endolytic transglycosylase MltG [Acidobacteriota bacterium]|nr:endolytic transglycosylase MltG [Acidobacteriota bacterium]
MRRTLRSLGSLVLFALLAAGAGAWLVLAPVGPARGTPDAQAVYVDVAPGTGAAGIATQLQRAGVLRSRFAFELLRAVKGGTLKAGEYRFNHPADAREVYARIARGDVYTIALSVPEGYNIFDIAQAAEAAGLAPKDQFLAAERSETRLIADLNPSASSLEGYLFPDTYRFPRTATPVQILGAMVRRFRQAAEQLGLAAEPKETLARTVVMASLVEKEVAVDTERPLVAGVFENRLARGIPLATDPAVIYAALLEGRYRGTIYASDLQAPSPYNTYRRPGLPPGPICNPGLAAFKAALAPAKTGFLYFVADAEGHSRFSSTLAEHTAHVQEYRRATGEAVPAPPSPTAAHASRASGKGKLHSRGARHR